MAIINLVQGLFFFYSYCFLGWCIESVYVSLRKGHWINRGFINGPFLPLYGTGALVLLYMTYPLKEEKMLVFLIGSLGASLLELITGVAMEMLFKVRYWDYSNRKWNLKGYICAFTSLSWGCLTLLMVEGVQGYLEKIMELFTLHQLNFIIIVLTFWIAGDFALSFRRAFDLKDLLIKLEQGKKELENIQDKLENLMEKASIPGELQKKFRDEMSDLHQRIRSIMQRRKWLLEDEEKKIRQIFKSNPTLVSARFRHVLEELKNSRKSNIEGKNNEKREKHI